jgi:hypothetical protein
MNNIFFIVGTGRCGTQMLRNVLNCWPNVVILPETHFIISLYDCYKLREITATEFLEVVDNVYGASGSKWSEVILSSSKRSYHNYQTQFINYIDENKIKGNIQIFIDTFYEFLYGKGKIFGDKTPHYGTNLTIIREIWPHAKAIHLIRDGLDCAHSMLGHPGFIRYINEKISPKDLDRVMYRRNLYKESHIKPTMEDAIHFWDSVINETQIELDLMSQSDVLQVMYEDIVFRPVEEIKKISYFLQIENDEKSLNKAIAIPRPFPERHQIKKLTDQDYQKYYPLIHKKMNFYGYPYKIEITRDLVGVCKEFYRGRFCYALQLKNKFKATFKAIVGK